jgi:hypothetical protein
MTMRTQNIEQTVLPHQHPEYRHTDSSERLEFIRVPLGSFAGTLERILIVRHGEVVAADTGDQGGGQN